MRGEARHHLPAAGGGGIMSAANVPTQQQLLAASDILLIVDEIQPPPGLVPKGQTPTLKAKERALFLAIDGSGRVWAFNGHVDLGTGVKSALTQIVAEELNLRMDQVHMVLGDTLRVPTGATIASATLQISAVPLRKAAATARQWLCRPPRAAAAGGEHHAGRRFPAAPRR